MGTDLSKNKSHDDRDKENNDTLPPCETAASPEHSRGRNEDEPCDDGRAGKIEKE